MISSKQCEIARLMTQDTASDIQINAEHQTITDDKASQIAQDVDRLCQQHDMPFEKGIAVMRADFYNIAQQHHISPSTLFCIYMGKR